MLQQIVRLMILLSLVLLLLQQAGRPPTARVPATLDGEPLQPAEVNTVVSLLVILL